MSRNLPLRPLKRDGIRVRLQLGVLGSAWVGFGPIYELATLASVKT